MVPKEQPGEWLRWLLFALVRFRGPVKTAGLLAIDVMGKELVAGSPRFCEPWQQRLGVFYDGKL